MASRLACALLLVVVALLAGVFAQTEFACPGYPDSFYTYVSTGKVFTTARGDAAALTASEGAAGSGLCGQPGHLIVIDSPEEQACLANFPNANVWLLAGDGTTEGTWQWTDICTSDPVTFYTDAAGCASGKYCNWADGEPDDADDQDCATVSTAPPNLWSSNFCSTQFASVVEFERCPKLCSQAQDSVVELGNDAANTAALNTWLGNRGGAAAHASYCGEITEFSDFDAEAGGSFHLLCGKSRYADVRFSFSDTCGNTAFSEARFSLVDTTAPTASNARSLWVDCTESSTTNQAAAEKWIAAAAGATVVEVNNYTATGSVTLPGSCSATGTASITITDACNNAIETPLTPTIIPVRLYERNHRLYSLFSPISFLLESPVDITLNTDLITVDNGSLLSIHALRPSGDGKKRDVEVTATSTLFEILVEPHCDGWVAVNVVNTLGDTPVTSAVYYTSCLTSRFSC